MTAPGEKALEGGDGRAFDPKNHQDVYRVAAETLELIHRHTALPDPVSYAVWFAFAAKSNSGVVAAISKKLAKDQPISPYDITEIYSEFLAGNLASGMNEQIGLRFEDSLTTISELIGEGSRNNRSFMEKLGALGQRIPRAETASEIDEIVSQLVVENEKMAMAMQVLDKGLAESQAQMDRLTAELDEMQKLSLRDPLTGVANRRAFDTYLAQTIEHSIKSHSPFCLSMVDIDHFKRVNDTLGHHTGDIVLQLFSRVLQRNTKGKDLVARCGGEEFAIILPETSIVAAHNLMVKIASEVRSAQFLRDQDHETIGKITASFGVCEYKPDLSAGDLYDRADTRLYDAKRSGRDRVRSDLSP